ncbi:MAG TPA: hypothetical protein VHE30_17075 [Polyangiaceae bacterium]|nr:hypothetical protein [Polyangiaceae bacterium]
MTANIPDTVHTRYARAILASRRARWDIDQDVLRAREFSRDEKFLPDGLSLIGELDFLRAGEQILVSQIQGRTYANVFGLVERFVNAKVLDLARDHELGDQVALEALIRFSDEELKHQELFRRVEALAEQAMPDGYRFLPEPNAVARVVLEKSAWAVVGLVFLIELFTQVHYKQSIEADPKLSELYRDVFRAHWMEEAQHAVIDELEWLRLDGELDDAARDRAVTDLIGLVGAVDGILKTQSGADAAYFLANAGRPFTASEQERVRAAFLRAYRYQYIFSGVRETRFPEVLASLVTKAQLSRVVAALDSLA